MIESKTTNVIQTNKKIERETKIEGRETKPTDLKRSDPIEKREHVREKKERERHREEETQGIAWDKKQAQSCQRGQLQKMPPIVYFESVTSSSIRPFSRGLDLWRHFLDHPGGLELGAVLYTSYCMPNLKQTFFVVPACHKPVLDGFD